MTIIDKFKETVKNHRLINDGDTIIVGASGGPDSQFLIYMLKNLSEEIDFKIILAHLNHLHRKQASEDENLVVKTADALNLDYKLRQRSMDDLARKLKISPEDAGRRLRYEFFNELAAKYPKAKIAVAHTKDDQAETVLMRIIRGTGLDGIRAMDYKNENIIRPILDIRKSELLAFLDSKGICYAIDHTNFESDYTRNKIRLDILPKIRELNPNITDQLFRLAELARDDLRIIEQKIDDLYENFVDIKGDGLYFDKNVFEKQSKPIQQRLLRRAILDLKGELKDISKENIDDFLKLIKLSNGKKIIKADIIFEKTYKNYRLGFAKKEKMKDELAFVGENQSINFNGIKIKTSIIKVSQYRKAKNKLVGNFDYDKLNFPLKVRYRQKGDTFIPLGLGKSKKLKDFFTDQKIDRDKRDYIPLILSDDKIVWICGQRMSDEFKVEKDTKKILNIEVDYEN